jgi:hypothetical protein
MKLPSVLGGLGALASKANSIISLSKFSNKNTIDNMDTEQGILFFIILILLIYFTMWLGALIFNMSVIKICPSIKKVTTLDFLGLYIVIKILFC